MSDYGNAYLYPDRVEVEYRFAEAPLSIPFDQTKVGDDRETLTNYAAEMLAGQRWSVDHTSWHKPRTEGHSWLWTAFAWRHS